MNLTRRHRARLWCERAAFRIFGWTHPYAHRQMTMGTGAWGRVTKRDRQVRAKMRAEIDRLFVSGEYNPTTRYRKDETGRFVRVTEKDA